MFGVLDGYYNPPTETDDNYKCGCGTPVIHTALPEYRSRESKLQGAARLCGTCWYKREAAAKAVPGNDTGKPK